MALLYDAVLQPSKTELLSGWAPAQPWFAGDSEAEITRVAAYRFDDPAGEVGLETLLVRAGDGPLLQVPLTYRSAPLSGAEAWLIGTMSHSVLGQRWVYDAVGDPVYLTAVATAACTGGQHAEQFLARGSDRVTVEPTALVIGSGSAGSPVPAVGSPLRIHEESGVTRVSAGSLRIALVRNLDAPVAGEGRTLRHADGAPPATLSGTWAGQPAPRILVTVG